MSPGDVTLILEEIVIPIVLILPYMERVILIVSLAVMVGLVQ